MISIVIVGSIVLGIIFGSKRRRRRRTTRTVVKRTQTVVSIRPTQAARNQFQAEQNRRARSELKRKQAFDDLTFIEQTRRDVLKLYGAAEAEFNRATTDRQKETALRRMIGYDAKLRKLDKDRETAELRTRIAA